MQPINLIGAVCTSAHEWDGAKNTKQLDIDHKKHTILIENKINNKSYYYRIFLARHR
ncbi:Uncharacterised protein [Escherichia coli]|uniref:Uncharacterized protein n=1 Tax=Escherichia coli TaxID=562 RepID=A0A376ZTN1_ECOLX|nr:Uncharacterised protein [Escherichia coli]